MIFYERETLYGLIAASVPAIVSVYFFFYKDRKQVALGCLLASAFLLRLLMISLDPYLHEWDERFHALVAKHMIDRPFVPMLFTHPIMAYDYRDWGYNHIWVHKQPLFLWQMALSMKLFGVHTFALRLPSALMGTILVWLVYDIGRKWTLNETVAFLAAGVAAFAHYALELIAGHYSLDHNDLAFLFYMTCSYWAFTRYVHSGHVLKWAMLTGAFAGMAILNKWLVGLLIYGGWGLYLILSEQRTQIRYYLHAVYAMAVTALVFVPWQLYILKAFPVESAIAFEGNRNHMTEDLGHPGSAWFHLGFLPTAYHGVLVGFMAIGLFALLSSRHVNRRLSVSFLAMTVVLFGFFSFLVATRMPAFVYPAAPFLYIAIAMGIDRTVRFVFKHELQVPLRHTVIFSFAAVTAMYCSLKPAKIIRERSLENTVRNDKIQNNRVFQNLNHQETEDRVILNCEPYENIELMFYQDVTAYHWYPSAEMLDSLQQVGYRFAAFQYHEHPQALPPWILEDPDVVVLDKGLR